MDSHFSMVTKSKGAAIVESQAVPTLSSAEIGTVNASTVVLTFSRNISAADYKAGITIKDGSTGKTISTGTRQTDHKVVYCVLSAPLTAASVVTVSYARTSGSYQDEANGQAVKTFTAHAVTNNTPAVVPEFASAEIGTVAATTVVFTLTENVVAAGGDYTTGMTISVNDTPVEIASGTRQTNHHIIRYVIPAVVNGDDVALDYDADTGLIVGETDGSPLDSITAQTVTNNVSA